MSRRRNEQTDSDEDEANISVVSIPSDGDSDGEVPSFNAPVHNRPRRRNNIVISDEEEDEEEEEDSAQKTRPASKSTPKETIVISSDEEGPQISRDTRAPQAPKMPIPQPASGALNSGTLNSNVPSFPIPQPYMPPAPTHIPSRPPAPSSSNYSQPPQPAYPNADTWKPKSSATQQRIVSLDMQQSKTLAALDALPKPPSSRPPALGMTQPYASRPGPSGHPLSVPQVGTSSYPQRPPASTSQFTGEEDLEIHVAPSQDDYYVKSKEEVDKDMHDLFTGAINSADDAAIDVSRAKVEGLSEKITLKTHQIISRDWMAGREEGKKRGGILADDMGLGKTLQSIVRIVDGWEKRQAPTLVVTPTSVVSQWVNEIETMAPKLKVTHHTGPSRTKDASKLEKFNVIVTSYATVQAEHKAHTGASGAKQAGSKSTSKKDESSSDDADHFGRTLAKQAAARKPAAKGKKFEALFNMEFYRVVLDEAHTIKNRATATAKACWALESQKRWCLTGTPMQNSIDELYPLLHFIGVRPYNDWDKYKYDVVDPIKRGRSGTAMKKLHVILKAIMLRRLKTDMVNGRTLIELPGREVKVVHCEFDKDEREFYNQLKDKIEIQVSKFQKAGTVTSNYTAILTLLLRLRQACNHPGLVTKDLSKDKDAIETRAADENKDDPLKDDEADELADALAGLSVDRKCTVCFLNLDNGNSTHGSKMCTSCAEAFAAQDRRKSLFKEYENPNLPPTSAKIRTIITLLRETKARGEGEKTIIFSQFTSFLDILQAFLVEEKISHVRLDGSMKIPDREASLNKIKSSTKTNVILVSFKAGSTGLNLTCCNHVILVDLWWNPALEEQAFDRAHRLGQQRDVYISKLTIEDTVEERILELQEKKREIARAALSGDKIKGNKLSAAELMQLFKSNHQDSEDEDD